VLLNINALFTLKNTAMQLISSEAENFINNSIEAIINSNLPERQKLKNFAALLDMPPHATWVEMHPTINGYAYIPISRVEGLLRLFFGTSYRVRVLSEGQLFNSVKVVVRLYYTCPISGKRCYQDGVGAKELQTQSKSGSLKLDMSNINRSAVEMALPIAKSTAIKDAADCIGRIFGADVMRKNTMVFEDSIVLNEQWQSFKPEHASDVLLRRAVQTMLSAAETPDAVGEIYKDKVIPFLAARGVPKQMFYGIAQKYKSDLQDKESQRSAPALLAIGDENTGELTEKQIAQREIDAIQNEPIDYE
jgi:hypothetical protein